MTWAIVPAAGAGTRFGGALPKQYHVIGARTVLEHSLRALLASPAVSGLVVVLAQDDARWPGWTSLGGRPLLTCAGGAERADSVLAGLDALPGGDDDAPVLVHDAARPCLCREDLDRLLAHAGEAEGALLAAPVRDTLKRAGDDGRVAATEARDRLWRALTPQLFRRGLLRRALLAARDAGATVTDEASAVERLGLRPRLVAGRDDNLKITTTADLALAAAVLSAAEEGRA